MVATLWLSTAKCSGVLLLPARVTAICLCGAMVRSASTYAACPFLTAAVSAMSIVLSSSCSSSCSGVWAASSSAVIMPAWP